MVAATVAQLCVKYSAAVDVGLHVDMTAHVSRYKLSVICILSCFF